MPWYLFVLVCEKFPYFGQDARVVLGIAILSNGKGHFGLTYRNDQTGQSGPPSNIPVGPNRNSPFHLISNRNFRNFGLNGKRPIFVVEEGSEGMQVNLGLKCSQKGGNIRKKQKIIYFSCIGYIYCR